MNVQVVVINRPFCGGNILSSALCSRVDTDWLLASARSGGCGSHGHHQLCYVAFEHWNMVSMTEELKF